MATTRPTYLPAAGYDWALPLYDPIVKLLGADGARAALLNRAPLRRGQRVLDVGCGTGTFVAMIARAQPESEVIGLDPDPKALAIARRKAARERLDIHVDRGVADHLPYDDGSFDLVFSTFMFHHLPPAEKLGMLREVGRVLKPGGRLYLADFAAPEVAQPNWISRRIHASDHLRANTDRSILTLLTQAGLNDAARTGEEPMVFGLLRVAFYEAAAPEVS